MCPIVGMGWGVKLQILGKNLEAHLIIIKRMVRSDSDIPQSFIVENSKQRINFNTECITNVTF